MQIRDRIKELRRVRADSLRPHPKNWRTHPDRQRDVLRGVLAEIGYADALLVRELPDGSLQLIDGHLRAETTPEIKVPVLVLDLTEDEAAKLLAVLDPLAGFAETNNDALADLLQLVETGNEAVGKLLGDLLTAPSHIESSESNPTELNIPDAFQVIVECRDEEDQRVLFERLQAEGYECRLLML
jgi:ParB-like chromosome segregation protein Spo0J